MSKVKFFPEIEKLATAALIPNARNSRTHSEEQIAQIAGSIREFGFTNPVLIADDNTIIAGHGRVLAAQKLGLVDVPCVRLGHLTQAQRRAYVIADNKLPLNAGWDEAMLRLEIDDLRALDFDVSMLGFSDDEMAALFAPAMPVGQTDENDVPDAPVAPQSRLGDIWILGGHRVMCGDSTSASDVAQLLAGATPHLMVTDPPYGVEYDAAWRNGALGGKAGGRAAGKVKNDDEADWSTAWTLFPGDVAYIWHAGVYAGVVEESLQSVGLEIRAQIIWAKNQMAIGRGDYHWKHEPCWYAVRKGKKGHYNGDRTQTTVWDIDKPQKSETGHSTQKPVECMRRPIINNSKAGDKVYDPFLGSGTTVIAAESEGRICYGLELNPAYVDVIVRRWQEFTGKTAVHAQTGKAFNSDVDLVEAA